MEYSDAVSVNIEPQITMRSWRIVELKNNEDSFICIVGSTRPGNRYRVRRSTPIISIKDSDKEGFYVAITESGRTYWLPKNGINETDKEFGEFFGGLVMHVKMHQQLSFKILSIEKWREHHERRATH